MELKMHEDILRFTDMLESVDMLWYFRDSDLDFRDFHAYRKDIGIVLFIRICRITEIRNEIMAERVELTQVDREPSRNNLSSFCPIPHQKMPAPFLFHCAKG